jgi:hypothetical protein
METGDANTVFAQISARDAMSQGGVLRLQQENPVK